MAETWTPSQHSGWLRQPNFHKWARPAYEQGALPAPSDVVIKVLPRDKDVSGNGNAACRNGLRNLHNMVDGMAAVLFNTWNWKPPWMPQFPLYHRAPTAC